MTQQSERMNHQDVNTVASLVDDLQWVRIWLSLTWWGWMLCGLPGAIHLLVTFNLNDLPAKLLISVNGQILMTLMVLFAGSFLYQLFRWIWHLDRFQRLVGDPASRHVIGNALTLIGIETLVIVDQRIFDLIGILLGGGMIAIYGMLAWGQKRLNDQLVALTQGQLPTQAMAGAIYQINGQKVRLTMPFDTNGGKNGR